MPEKIHPQVVVKDGDEIHMMDPIHRIKSKCFKRSWGGTSQKNLDGGFKYYLFVPLFGEMSQFD